MKEKIQHILTDLEVAFENEVHRDDLLDMLDSFEKSIDPLIGDDVKDKPVPSPETKKMLDHLNTPDDMDDSTDEDSAKAEQEAFNHDERLLDDIARS